MWKSASLRCGPSSAGLQIRLLRAYRESRRSRLGRQPRSWDAGMRSHFGPERPNRKQRPGRAGWLLILIVALQPSILEGASRTGWDSNPRGQMPTRFPVVRLKPLGHPSLIAGPREDRRSVCSRGARIRTGDLCDPNAALYRTEPRPVWIEPSPIFAFGFMERNWGTSERRRRDSNPQVLAHAAFRVRCLTN